MPSQLFLLKERFPTSSPLSPARACMRRRAYHIAVWKCRTGGVRATEEDFDTGPGSNRF